MQDISVDFCGVLGLRIRVGNRLLARIFRSFFSGHLAGGAPLQEPDLLVETDGPLPDAPDGFRVDDRYLVGRDCIRFRSSSKLASWETALSGLAGPTARVTVRSNLPGYWVFPHTTIMDILKIRMLQKGYVALHGLAADFRGRGLLFAGRSGIGKTITAFRLASSGFRILADDTVFINREGVMTGFLQPVGIRSTYDLKKETGFSLEPADRAAQFLNAAVRIASLGTFTPFLQVPAGRAFSGKTIASSPLFTAVFGQEHDGPAARRPLGAPETAERLLNSSRFESVEAAKLLNAYAWAFPSTPLSRLLDSEGEILGTALSGKALYAADIPAGKPQEAFRILTGSVEAL